MINLLCLVLIFSQLIAAGCYWVLIFIGWSQIMLK